QCLLLCCSYSRLWTVPAVSPADEEKRHQTTNHSTEAFLRGRIRDRDSLWPSRAAAGHPAVRLVRGVPGREAVPRAPDPPGTVAAGLACAAGRAGDRSPLAGRLAPARQVGSAG